MRTGDLGALSDDGSLLLAGRAKRTIIRGQANIYPDLVEPLLLARDDLGLRDCALVGLPDRVTGDESVVLAVVPAPHVLRDRRAWPRRQVGRDARSARQTVQALARAVHRVWPALADEAWRPDELVVVEAIPRRGRSGAVDLDSVRALVAEARGSDRG